MADTDSQSDVYFTKIRDVLLLIKGASVLRMLKYSVDEKMSMGPLTNTITH